MHPQLSPSHPAATPGRSLSRGEGAQGLPPPAGTYITALSGRGQWRGSPQTPQLSAAGQAGSSPSSCWAQLHGWRFPARAGVFMFP